MGEIVRHTFCSQCSKKHMAPRPVPGSTAHTSRHTGVLYLLLGDRYCFMRISFLLERRVSSSDAGFSFLESCIRHDAPSEILPSAVPCITRTVASAHRWSP